MNQCHCFAGARNGKNGNNGLFMEKIYTITPNIINYRKSTSPVRPPGEHLALILNYRFFIIHPRVIVESRSIYDRNRRTFFSKLIKHWHLFRLFSHWAMRGWSFRSIIIVLHYPTCEKVVQTIFDLLIFYSGVEISSFITRVFMKNYSFRWNVAVGYWMFSLKCRFYWKLTTFGCVIFD